VARSWAGAWAAGIQCDDKCFVDIEAVVDSVGTVLVDAVTEAYAFVCGGASLKHLHLIPCPVLSSLDACYYTVLAATLLRESRCVGEYFCTSFHKICPF
jgi:hypothetical protein